MNEQQDKAIERLAAVLIDMSTGAVMHGRVPTRVPAMDTIVRVWTKPDDGGVDDAWQNAVEAARRIASELGLVAVSPGLLDAARRASKGTPVYRGIGSAREVIGYTQRDAEQQANYERACVELAEAVLAATEPKL